MSFQVEVKGQREWGAVAVVAFFAVFVAMGIYGTIRIECSRTSPGQPARCSGRTTKLYSSYDLPPFTLERDSFRRGQSEPDSYDHRYPTLITPTGTLQNHATLDPSFVDRVITETNAFYENKDARAWEVAASTWKSSLITLLIGGSLIGFWLWLWGRAVTIQIDPRGGYIQRGNDVWPIAKIESVRQHHASRDGSEIDVMVDGVPTTVCAGRDEKSAAEATRAIERAIKDSPS